MSKKAELLNLVRQADRGLKTTTALNQAIYSAIAYLEEQNPTPHPTASPALAGNWELLFTTSQELLGFGRIPFAQLGKIYQCIRLPDQSLYNIAELYGLPLLSSVVSVSAAFTVSSPRRVEVKFERLVIGFQGLLQYRGVDEFIQFLTTGKRAIALDVKIDREQQGWLEITYLDSELRIGRGNQGNVFVLQKVPTITF